MERASLRSQDVGPWFMCTRKNFSRAEMIKAAPYLPHFFHLPERDLENAMTVDLFPEAGRMTFYFDSDRTVTQKAFVQLAQRVGCCCQMCGVVSFKVPSCHYVETEEYQEKGWDGYPSYIRHLRNRFSRDLEHFAFWCFGRWACFPNINGDDAYRIPLLPICADCGAVLGRQPEKLYDGDEDWSNALRLERLWKSKAYRERRDRNARNIIRLGPSEVMA